MNYKYFYLLSLIFLIGCSNELEFNSSINEEYVAPEGVKFYATEEDFTARFSNGNQTPNSYWDETVTTRSTIVNTCVEYGFDRIEYGNWEKASYGTFITKYGLQPYTIYLERKAICVKNLPCGPTDGIIERQYNADGPSPMGFVPGMTVNNKYVYGYQLSGSYNPQYGTKEAKSFVFHVGSDMGGIYWDVYYPYKPQDLVWHYKTVTDDGDW